MAAMGLTYLNAVKATVLQCTNYFKSDTFLLGP